MRLADVDHTPAFRARRDAGRSGTKHRDRGKRGRSVTGRVSYLEIATTAANGDFRIAEAKQTSAARADRASLVVPRLRARAGSGGSATQLTDAFVPSVVVR